MKKKRSSHDLGLGMDFFNWNVIALQCGVSFSMQRSDSAICTHVSPPSGTYSLPHPTHPGHRKHELGPLCIPPTQVIASMGWALCASHPPRSSRARAGPTVHSIHPGHRDQGWAPCVVRQLPASCFTCDRARVSIPTSRFVPPSPSHPTFMSVLYICISIPALEIGPAVPFF